MSKLVSQNPSACTPSSKPILTNVVQNGNQNAIPLKQSPNSTTHIQTTALQSTPTSNNHQGKKPIGQTFAGQNENEKIQNIISKPLAQSVVQPNAINNVTLSNGNEKGGAKMQINSNLSSPNQLHQTKLITQQTQHVQVTSTVQQASPKPTMGLNLQNRASIPAESNAMKRKLETQTSAEDQQFKRFGPLKDFSKSPQIISSASSVSSEEVPLASLPPSKKVMINTATRSPSTLLDSIKEGLLIKDEKIKKLTSDLEKMKDITQKVHQKNAILEEKVKKGIELNGKYLQEIKELQQRCKEYDEIFEKCFSLLKENGVNF